MRPNHFQIYPASILAPGKLNWQILGKWMVGPSSCSRKWNPRVSIFTLNALWSSGILWGSHFVFSCHTGRLRSYKNQQLEGKKSKYSASKFLSCESWKMLELDQVSHGTWACRGKEFRCSLSLTVFIKCILFNAKNHPRPLLKHNFRKSSLISTTCQWLFNRFKKTYSCFTFLLNSFLTRMSGLCKNSVSSKIINTASEVFPVNVQPASQSHGNSLQRRCFCLVWNKFLPRWTIQCLRITLLTINRDKEIQLHCSHGIPLSLDTSVKMHTSEPEWRFCLIVSLRTHESFCQNDLISWHTCKTYTVIDAFWRLLK